MSLEEQRKRAEFAERVRVRLAALGKTRRDLAREYGINESALYQNFANAPYVTYSILERLAAMLEVEVDWLLAGDLRDGVPEPQQPLLDALDAEETI